MRAKLLGLTAALALLLGLAPTAHSHGECRGGGWHGGPSIGLGLGFGGFGGFPYYGGGFYGGGYPYPYYAPAYPAVMMAPSVNVSYRPGYRNSDRNTAIQRVQARLRSFGYYRGPIDGRFGAGTQRAIVNFQRDSGLPATGRIDGRTLRLLK